MNSSLLISLLVCFFTSSVWGLQVTPNSPCSSVCIDDPTTDASDPNSSNTYASDIVCIDSDYDNTSVGRKFKQCLTCLQNSTASSGSENDQGWFFYNLRFAFDTCLFNPLNASDNFSTPCSQATVCAPIKGGVEASLQTTATMGGLYSYCTAADSSFVGSNLPICESCLRENPAVFYLSNFLVALDAGCLQEPSNGTTVGLNMTLFSNTQVSITNAITPGLQAQSTTHHKSISTGTIIGITVAVALILLILAAIVFIHFRKRRNADRLHKLRSPLDERFGAENISAPNKGAFSSPQTSPGLMKGDIKMVYSPPIRNFSISRPSAIPQRAGEWTGTAPDTPSTTFSNSVSGSPPGYDPSPLNSGRQEIPTHVAYIPPGYTPPSSNNVSPAYNAVPPPRPSQGLPATYPQRSRSIAGSNPNTSPRYVHYSPNSSSSNRTPASPPLAQAPSRSGSSMGNYSSRTPTSPPIRAPSRSGSSLSNRNPAISPSLINTLPSPPLPTISTFPPTYTSPPTSASYNTQTHNNTSEISPPLPRPVNSRFENDDEARKARERLYREGLVGRTLIHGREEEPQQVGRSPESESSEEELWPGNY